MIKVAIIGGKLQGTEAVYLAKKAGFRSILIDKNPHSPASGFCDEHAVFDVLKKEAGLIELLKSADFILPALENDEVHAILKEIAEEHHLKLAFDTFAYAITSSKLKSDRLMQENGIPAPCYFPDCKPPYIIKPSGESGSAGVRKAETKEEVTAFLAEVKDPQNWIVQEFVTGDSYSIEVIGVPGNYRTYTITQIHMDEAYDCNKVTAPCALTSDQVSEFENLAVKLAALVNLHGIMDVEVIDHDGMLKVLEIDARLPSQTPMVVYHTSGINLLAELADLTINGHFTNRMTKMEKHSSIEHFRVSRDGIAAKGEHIMSSARPLTVREDFFGADEVLSDYAQDAAEFCGTFINSADSAELLQKKRESVQKQLLHSVFFTVTQKERLTELAVSEDVVEKRFADVAERNVFFRKTEKEYVKANREKIRKLLREKHAPDTYFIEQELSKWLMEGEGFTRVTTPTIITSKMLDQMTITEDNHLREQVFWIDGKKCLRPMLAPNLYVVMRELKRVTNEPIKIFEIGPCFRKESQGAQHMNEFTMLNFVELASIEDGRQMERLEFMAKAAMQAVGIEEYELVKESSAVYGETLDVVVGGIELASGSYGPHALDAAWGVFDTWVGLGFGIERIALVKAGYKTIKRVGKSIMFIDGSPLNI